MPKLTGATEKESWLGKTSPE